MKIAKITLLINICFFSIGVFAQTETPKSPDKSDEEITGPDYRISEIRTRLTKATVTAETKKNAELAISYTKQGKFAEALKLWTDIIKTNPKLEAAYSNRGHIYMKVGKLDLAVKDLNKAIDISPSTDAYNSRGYTFAEMGKFDQALADFSKAIELDPKDSLSYNNRADLYTRLNQYKLAIEDQSKAISIYPGEPVYYANRCGSFVKTQLYDNALKDCNKSIELNPRRGPSYISRGTVHFYQSRIQAALSDFNKALELDKSLTIAYSYKGIALVQLRRFEEAIENINKAIDAEPTALIYLYRAEAYQGLNKSNLVVADYQNALELDPNNAGIHNNLGSYYFKIGEKKKALEHLTKAIELNPKFSVAYQNRATMYRSMGNIEKARADESMLEKIKTQ